MPTKIPWADEVWNVTAGCTKVSSGCENCYAERMAKRLKGMGIPQYQDVVDEKGWTGKVVANADILSKPRHWKKPRRIFVDSMSDLFKMNREGWVPIEFYAALFSIMLQTPQHTYMILTKRPVSAKRVLESTKAFLDTALGLAYPWPLPNVWMGVSVENQDTADQRIPRLLEIPAALRFISAEPLLGPVDLNYWHNNLDVLDWTKSAIDWVIAGCETGPNRRNADIAWFRSLRDQCEAAEVPFFLKQMEIDGKISHLPEFDRTTWRQFPVVK
jgi:protein gp37